MAEQDFITKGPDFLSEIDSELTKLIALGDLLTQLKGDYDFRDDTLESVGFTITKTAEQIQKVLWKNPGPQGAGDDWKLDPITKENILKDAKNLQNMASKIQLIAEGLCLDLGLELPPNIKERIVRGKVAREEAA
jgi:hypothetical protein